MWGVQKFLRTFRQSSCCASFMLRSGPDDRTTSVLLVFHVLDSESNHVKLFLWREETSVAGVWKRSLKSVCFSEDRTSRLFIKSKSNVGRTETSSTSKSQESSQRENLVSDGKTTSTFSAEFLAERKSSEIFSHRIVKSIFFLNSF